jgi:hypothetical protein
VRVWTRTFYIETNAIVLHDEEQGAVPSLEDDVCAGGFGMTNDIGQGLLDNPIQSGL